MHGCCLNRARLATKLDLMLEELVCSERVRADLLRATAAAAPRECAAVLGGSRGPGRASITQLVEVPNVGRGEDAFAVDPVDFARAERAITRRGLTFLGFAHSHPRGAAAPSLRDLKELWTGCFHLIAGASQVRAFWLDRSRVPHAVALTAQEARS